MLFLPARHSPRDGLLPLPGAGFFSSVRDAETLFALCTDWVLFPVLSPATYSRSEHAVPAIAPSARSNIPHRWRPDGSAVPDFGVGGGIACLNFALARHAADAAGHRVAARARDRCTPGAAGWRHRLFVLPLPVDKRCTSMACVVVVDCSVLTLRCGRGRNATTRGATLPLRLLGERHVPSEHGHPKEEETGCTCLFSCCESMGRMACGLASL